MSARSMASGFLFALFTIGIYATGVLTGRASATGRPVIEKIDPASFDRLEDASKPFVIATFVAFAAFPIAVVLAHDFTTLVGAFIVGGLREVGEPARKAMIVDLVRPSLRARSIGLYYLVRSLTVAPAAFFGGVLWRLTPAAPFWVAGAIGLVGVAVFAATVEERYAS